MQVLLKPVVTEKTSIANEKGVYVFVVNKRANKIQIQKTIEEIYGVTVDKVRTVNMLGKPKARFTKTGHTKGRTASYKKAYVSLVEGDMIDIYEGIED